MMWLRWNKVDTWYVGMSPRQPPVPPPFLRAPTKLFPRFPRVDTWYVGLQPRQPPGPPQLKRKHAALDGERRDTNGKPKQKFDAKGIAASSTGNKTIEDVVSRSQKQNAPPRNSHETYPVRERDVIYATGLNPPHRDNVFDCANSAPTHNDLSECEKCGGTSWYASNFLEVDEETLEVVYDPTSPATIAVTNIKNITENKGGRGTDPDGGGRERRVINICWQCLGCLKHNSIDYFLRNNAKTGKSHVTSFFHNMRTKTSQEMR